MTKRASPYAWAPDTWAQRLAARNPVWPYEWAVIYQGGGVFKRVCAGRVRTSRDAPLTHARALRVWGPGIRAVELDAPPGPILGLDIGATIVGRLGDTAGRGVAAWRFGFRTPAGVWGIVLDAYGRPTRVRPDTKGDHMRRVLVGGLLLFACTGCTTEDKGTSVHCFDQRPSAVSLSGFVNTTCPTINPAPTAAQTPAP